MFEDMGKFSVLGPALVLLQDLDETGSLCDLEAGQGSNLLAGAAVVLVGWL